MPHSDTRRHSPPLPSHVDREIWQACAGAAVQIPNVNSRVYYFPQGHLEHASPPLNPHYSLSSLSVVHCRVSNVQFLADPFSDEVFAKILLEPVSNRFANDSHNEVGGDGGKVVSFAKILTPSDANNGGGFSVPRFCADSVLPPLNFEADPPLQILNVTDVHGKVWQFRHIYRGTPRRHLLTSGWSKFLTLKKLVAGDSVIFMKNSKGLVFVGIRRVFQFSGTEKNRADEEEEEGDSGGYWRRGRKKVTVKAVAEVAEAAAQGMPFEVVHYPSAGWSDFVVKAEVVEEAMRGAWGHGMRVKMTMETEDSSRMTWFQGTVTSASVPDNGPWRGSPWRMLQVAWDEPEVLKNAKRVSPWQVELVSPQPSLRTAFPPTKKFRFAQVAGVLSDREGDPYFPMTWFTNSTMEHLNQTLLSSETFPAGMQGARHDVVSASKNFNFTNSIDNHYLRLGSSSFVNNTMPMLETVSTELNIGSSQSDDLSPNSQSSLHSFCTEFAGAYNCNTAKVGSGSILLFGKIIQPVVSDIHDACCMGDNGNKGCGETEGIDNPPDHSLTYSKLLNRLDVQSELPLPVEASFL
ncbi:hypothetical protein TanjilG_02788 [Lupinus angustifolius]|uniref:Auxin response factor n=1 Tax=Lupinus angustifolius TaxID=3871 RepID=A0A1J7IV10_LUPAN|nr:PREDICTED: auxin response factor 17-like [Lupinus angustifolius]OIW16582.1 hypothetical protein TanjilG_02788 [Lupinus angustifolius]